MKPVAASPDVSRRILGSNEFIRRRPIAAFGNSDADLEMLQWTTKSAAPALGPLSATPMRHANTPTTGTHLSAASTKPRKSRQ